MSHPFDVIESNLIRAAAGEPLPGIGSTELEQLVEALRAAQGSLRDEGSVLARAPVARRLAFLALRVMLARLGTSMEAEREWRMAVDRRRGVN